MRAFLLLTVLTIAVPVRPDIAPKAEKPAEPVLLGDWQVLSYQALEKRNHTDAVGSTFTFSRDEIQIRKKGREHRPEEDAGYSVDWTKMPVAINLVPRSAKDLILEGILKIEGDRLTICFVLGPPGSRPRDFVVAPDSATAIVQLKRIRP